MGGSRPVKIIFFGTPDYVLPILTSLHKEYVTGPGKSPIVAVVTQSPKPVGRKQVLTYSPIDKWAHEKGIDTRYDFSAPLPEADFGVCAAFGAIIPKSIIDHFKFGILNIHPSLLPKYRGASPIQSAIAAGETETGVTIIKMDEKMDHGPVVSSFKEEILPTDTGETLRTRLFEKSAQFLIDLIPNYIKGKIRPKPQKHEDATYTKIVTKQDGFIDLEKDDPVEIERKLRAYTPWPGIWTKINDKRLKILEFKNEPITVQLEGKTPVSWKQFKNAYKID